MSHDPYFKSFIFMLNQSVNEIHSWFKSIDHYESMGLVDFVFRDRVDQEKQSAREILERNHALIDAIEAVRRGKTEGPLNFARALNDSFSHLPKFTVDGQKVIPIKYGYLALQTAYVLDKIDWNLLKRCRECNRYFYGGGQRKIYCRKACERKSSNRYNAKRDAIRSALYRFNKRREKGGMRTVTRKEFIEKHYKPKG